MTVESFYDNTYQSLDVEALCGHDSRDVFFGEGFQDGGLTGVVKTEDQNTCLLLVLLEASQKFQQTHIVSSFLIL